MTEIIPRVCIDGREVDFLKGAYVNPGSMSAATISFELSVSEGVTKKLWNKEVTLYLNQNDTVPLFRGWIKRTKPTFNTITIMAEDGLGYMVRGGEREKAKVVLDNFTNIDGLTVGTAIKKLLEISKLNNKVKTDYIGDTSPKISSSSLYIRGEVGVMDAIQSLLQKAINTEGNIPRPNVAKLIDDGINSQLVIELESDLDSDVIVHTFTEHDNIVKIDIVNRKIPTVITVIGKDGVSGRFTHDTALEAYDRNFLQATNDTLKSPAECRDFAMKLFEANLKLQYEYAIQVLEGAYLSENEVIRVQTDEPEYAGNYRVIGKMINFSPTGFSIGLSINKKPPTLAEYIASRDN